MAVKVLIQRRCAPGNERRLQDLLVELRSEGLSQPGYLAGETLFDIADPRTVVVLSSWSRKEDWEQWQKSERRQVLDSQIQDLLTEPETVQVLREPKAADNPSLMAPHS